MSAALADAVAPGDLVRLVGAVDAHACVERRSARALVVRWHGHLYQAAGAVADVSERVRHRVAPGGAPVWVAKTFEPWERRGRGA